MSTLDEAFKELLLTEAKNLFDGCSKESNPEYLRGMSELIAGVCTITGSDEPSLEVADLIASVPCSRCCSREEVTTVTCADCSLTKSVKLP